MNASFQSLLTRAAALLAAAGIASLASADGHINASTVVTASQGTYAGIQYTRFEAMFEGVTSNNRPYRVPCQIIAPSTPSQGSSLLLFDWLVPSTIPTAVGQEQADARYTMTDNFLFSRGISYATVRCQQAGIGRRSPVADPTRPWSDGLLDTSSEFITSEGDEFDIVVDYNKALKTDPVAQSILGQTNRTAAFGYSASGYRLRGLLRLQMGKGLFAFSLVGGTGTGFTHPIGNGVGSSSAEKAPLPGSGLEIDFQSETDIVGAGGFKCRHEESNYRAYQFAGTSHIRDIDVIEFGLADPQTANSAEWTPFIRALFVAANRWCDGISPPPSVWLGAPNDSSIARDANGNALVRYVGTRPFNTSGFRLPEVAVGENQYIPVAPAYDDGTFLGYFRTLGGGHIDLTGNLSDHNAYVSAITTNARNLQSMGYLLPADADAIILRASLSNIGH